MNAKKVDVVKIRAMTLDTLGLHIKTLSDLLNMVLGCYRETREADWKEFLAASHTCYDRQATPKRIAIAKRVTVQEAIEAWDARETDADTFKTRKTPCIKHFVRRLVELGMTRVDWYRLPQTTMASVSLTKEQWLDQRVLLLGTLSYSALQVVKDSLVSLREISRHDLLRRDITVRDLLTCDGRGYYSYWKQYRRSLENTCRKLRQLGFGPEDGPFMKRGLPLLVKQKWITKVREQCGLSEGKARIVVEAARKLRWGPSSGPVDWEVDK